MTTWMIIKLAVIGLFGYVTVGSLAVLLAAYVSARVEGHWFSGQNRRWGNGYEGVPPAVVFWLWPVAAPLTLIYALVAGWGAAVEYLGDRVRAAGERSAKRLRGGTTP